MREHELYERLLARWDELTATEERRLKEHLAGCDDCRETALVYARQDEALRAFAVSQPRPQLRHTVLQQLEGSQKPLRPRRSWSGIVCGAMGAGAGLSTVAAILALVWWIGGGSWPGEVRQPASRYLSTCSPATKSWALQGPCEVIDSPEAFRRPGVHFYELSWEWVQSHMLKPHYVVRHGKTPPVILGKGDHVVFSQVAFDPRSNSAVYAVSTGKRRGDAR